MTYDARSRAQLRAALVFWRQAMCNSRVQPSEIPECQIIFGQVDALPLTEEEITDLIHTLMYTTIYTSIPKASKRHKIGAHRIRREFHRFGIKPEVGTRWYTMTDMIAAINRIRRRDGKTRNTT